MLKYENKNQRSAHSHQIGVKMVSNKLPEENTGFINIQQRQVHMEEKTCY